ncbi:MAG: response regulator transcription factor [Caldilinea sp.]|nr:response regulator transcription factor [Caldilinea sp.]MDW8441581.1 response regulator transcription factor [Caldilineaceae bacterium]
MPLEEKNFPSSYVLIIEDEQTIIEFLRVGLAYEGFQVEIACDGWSGLRLFNAQKFDLVILDLMLPDLNGLEICRRLRSANPDVAIILLTAKREIPDRIAGLNLGADDYVTKPFSFEELLARIRAVLRRRGRPQEQAIVTAADIMLNCATHEVHKNGEPIDLTPKEFALLELFMRHPRRVFTRETLLNRIWGFDFAGDTNVVDVHIHHLREKIGDRAKRLIRTNYGLGYSFRPDEDDPLA